MKHLGRSIGIAVAALVASAPVSILVTLLLFPLWSWIEDTFHVESVGHSGPAGWCFVATFGVIAAILVGLGVYTVRHSAERI